MKKILLAFIILGMISCTATKEVEVVKEVVVKTDEANKAQSPVIKNVILLIGDGMGLSQVSSSFYFGAVEEPNFTRFPFIGLSRTSSASHKVTDSASGATAFASGIKTYNGAIGMDVDQQPVETIIERIAQLNSGIMTGLIATSSITHATPACFYAHVKYRKQEEDIAYQMVDSPVDFFAGGGLKFFNKRADQKDLLAELTAKGFVMDTLKLGGIGTLTTNKKYGYLLAEKGLPSKLDGRDDFTVQATLLALDYLSKSKDGFFLMVEGSQIDWEGHATNVQGVVQEVRDFDKAIGAALDFAEQDGQTLVVVTADHETGGFALSPPFTEIKRPYSKPYVGWDYNQIEGSFYENADTTVNPSGKYSAAHNATLVPVFAYGPNSERFAGIYQNNDIFHKIVEIMNW